MHGWLKVARKRWPKCQIHESEDAGWMDVRSAEGELLVSARRNGLGGMHCAQERTGAKYPLSVLQSEANPLPKKEKVEEKA